MISDWQRPRSARGTTARAPDDGKGNPDMIDREYVGDQAEGGEEMAKGRSMQKEKKKPKQKKK
jgi:hypothetical protein